MVFQPAVFVTLFPLILPVWQERPIGVDDIMPGPYPVEYTAEQITLQREGFHFADRELRGVIARELRDSGLQSAFDVLRAQLGRETDPRVQATLLEFLSHMPQDDPRLASQVVPLLTAADQDIRYWALALYGRLETASLERIAPCLFEDSSESVRELAARTVLRRFAEVPADLLTRMWDDPRPVVAASGLLGATYRADIPGAVERATTAARSGDVLVRWELATSLERLSASVQARLLPILSQDSSSSVRGECAAAIAQIGSREYLPILLALCTDGDAEVRRRAVVACGAFPGAEVLTACSRRLEDRRALVRGAAEETLVAIDADVFVGDTLAQMLPAAAEFARHHIYRVLGRLDHRQFAELAARQLQRETRPRNLASGVTALGRFEARFAASQVAALGNHDDAAVRASVARTLGRLGVPATFDTISRLVFDAVPDVRDAAIIAMGVTGDGSAFGKTILKVMQTVQLDKMTSENRAAGAWAAGQCRPVNRDLLERLVLQATTPVVPGDMGEKLFEEDYVLVSVALALAACARDDAAARPFAEQVLRIHGAAVTDRSVPALPETLMPSAEVVEYARQARALMNGEEVEAKPRPLARVSFSYQAMRTAE